MFIRFCVQTVKKSKDFIDIQRNKIHTNFLFRRSQSNFAQMMFSRFPGDWIKIINLKIKSQTYKVLTSLIQLQCTGRYFKVQDDDLSSKQGSLRTTFKTKITQKLFLSNAHFMKPYRSPVYLYTGYCCYKIKNNMNIFFV